MYKLPESSTADLVPLASQAGNDQALNIITIAQLSEQQKKELVKIN